MSHATVDPDTIHQSHPFRFHQLFVCPFVCVRAHMCVPALSSMQFYHMHRFV